MPSFLETLSEIIDAPIKLIGNGIDAAYDATIGELTNTKDLFTGEDAAIIPELASMLIPGAGVVKGVKALNNLRNVKLFENAVKDIPEINKVKGTVNGHLAAYGQDEGAKRAGYLMGQYTKADKANKVTAPTELTFGNLNVPMSERASTRILDNLSIESPVPLYRGGDKNGIFFTPDKRIAKDYRTGGSLSDLIFNKNGMAVTKLPKGTKTTPGRFYPDSLAPQKDIPGRETIVLPEWRKRG